jgi:hypothetical protein
MSIYKRNEVYWFKFMFEGQLIRKSTKQGNDRTAREEESKERSRLVKERDERAAAKRKLNCGDVCRCQECSPWFDAAITITGKVTERFCSNHCHDT